jgi:hypothetical protein
LYACQLCKALLYKFVKPGINDVERVNQLIIPSVYTISHAS